MSETKTHNNADDQQLEDAVAEEQQPEIHEVTDEAVVDHPADVDDQIAALKSEVEKNLDGWQRSRAEFTNYKKRVEREMQEIYARASGDALASLLPIIDDFERALDNIPEDLQDHPWASGISLIQRKLEKFLDEHDIEVIDPKGEPFDPTRHEAIGSDDSDEVESGHVSITLQKGYAHSNRILRAALVRIAN